MVLVNADSDNVTFFCNDMGVGNVDLNIRSLDYNTFDDDDPGTIILVRLIAWCDRYKKCKEHRKEISLKLIPVVWHSRRW